MHAIVAGQEYRSWVSSLKKWPSWCRAPSMRWSSFMEMCTATPMQPTCSYERTHSTVSCSWCCLTMACTGTYLLLLLLLLVLFPSSPSCCSSSSSPPPPPSSFSSSFFFSFFFFSSSSPLSFFLVFFSSPSSSSSCSHRLVSVKHCWLDGCIEFQQVFAGLLAKMM